jgi:hypothetical protein
MRDHPISAQPLPAFCSWFVDAGYRPYNYNYNKGPTGRGNKSGALAGG